MQRYTQHAKSTITVQATDHHAVLGATADVETNIRAAFRGSMVVGTFFSYAEDVAQSGHSGLVSESGIRVVHAIQS
jgi:hypothetical protein